MLAALLVAGLMAACGPSRPPPAAPPEPVTLGYVTFDALGGLEEALIAQYESLHPHVEIDLQRYRQAPLTYLAASTPPDLMLIVPGEQLNAAIQQGMLTDISELWQELGLDASFPTAFRLLTTHDGKQFLLPLGYTWNGVYYNRSVFDRYNLQPPRTWDEFITLCDTLLLNGETPLAISGRDPFTALLWLDYLGLRLYGAAFQRQLAAGEIPYTDPRVRTVFELWRSLVERGYFLEEASTLTGLNAAMTLVRQQQLDLVRGRAAMIVAGPAALNELPEPFRAELDFFPFPIIDPTAPVDEVVLVAGYMVPSAAPHRIEALAYLAYLNTDAARTLVSQDVNAASLYIPALAHVEALNPSSTMQQGQALVARAQAVVTPYFLSTSQPMQAAVNDALRRLLADPRQGSPFNLDEVLDRLEAARQRG
ncbi:MAG: ABC transporter substrate-binding protein [Caldilineaceae bacterium]|nr:ABC transporter substrate-binding protein [Caldilineaceae bacterium]